MVGPGPGETALHSTDAYMDSHSFGLKMVGSTLEMVLWIARGFGWKIVGSMVLWG